MALTADGQISRPEVAVLIKLASQVPAGNVIVEVGSFRGRSAIALALGSRAGGTCRVYAVDPHLPYRGVHGGEFGPADQAVLYRNLYRAGVGELVAVVSLSSEAAARGWPGPAVGLLFLDGDHTYEGVRLDWQAWSPHLAPTATVAFHDRATAGVRRLLEELVEGGVLCLCGEARSLAWYEWTGRAPA